MEKTVLNNLLNKSLKRKESITKKKFFKRLISHPDMLIQTIFCWVLNKSKLYIPYKTKTFWKKKINIIFPEVVSSEIRRFGFIEESVASFIINFAKEGDTIIDVGAHFGFFTLLMSDLVGNKGKVHSFEPIPSTFAILRKNAFYSKNIFLNKNAVWNVDCELELYDYGLASSAFNSVNKSRDNKNKQIKRGKKIKVKTVTLDNYVFKNRLKPKLIKIDAESAEYQVLQGMDKILSNFNPLLCIELGDLGINGVVTSREIIDFLINNYGYKPYFIQQGKLIEHQLLEKYKYTNLFFKK